MNRNCCGRKTQSMYNGPAGVKHRLSSWCICSAGLVKRKKIPTHPTTSTTNVYLTALSMLYTHTREDRSSRISDILPQDLQFQDFQNHDQAAQLELTHLCCFGKILRVFNLVLKKK